MKRRNFLNPVSVTLAALIATGSANADIGSKNGQPPILQEQSKALNSLAKDAENLVLSKAEQKLQSAYHRSHYSHRSHSSHRSHYSSRY